LRLGLEPAAQLAGRQVGQSATDDDERGELRGTAQSIRGSTGATHAIAGLLEDLADGLSGGFIRVNTEDDGRLGHAACPGTARGRDRIHSL
jgi:hypothetical protein